MPNILSSACEPALRRFALSSVVVGFDYDGTLAPIAETPDQARMRPSTRRLLTAVARRYPCVVISGRSRADLAARIGFGARAAPFRKPWDGALGRTSQDASRVARWARTLRDALAGHAGVFVEQKTYSLTVHYRKSRDKSRAIRPRFTRRWMRFAARGSSPGSQAVNVVPAGAPNKGVARPARAAPARLRPLDLRWRR